MRFLREGAFSRGSTQGNAPRAMRALQDVRSAFAWVIPLPNPSDEPARIADLLASAHEEGHAADVRPN